MSLRKDVLANYLGQGWSALIGIAFVPLYIKYLGVESYGLIGIFMVMQGWLALLDMGVTPTLNREMARFSAGAHSPQSIRDLLRSLEILSLCIAALVAVGLWAASGWLARDWLNSGALPTPVVAQAISIMAFVVALRLIEGIYHGSLFGLQRQVWYNTANAVLATARSGGAAALLIWGSPTIQAFFLWQVCFSLFSVAVYASKVHRTLPKSPRVPKFSREALAGIGRFAGGVMGITFLAVLLTQIDKVLLSRLITLESFGYYALAAAVATVIYMVTGPIDNAIYPRMVKLATQGDVDGLAAIYHQSAQLITVLTAPAALLLVFFADGVVFMWSGNSALAANTGPILSVLALGTFLNGLMHIPYQLQLAHGWTRLAIKTNVVAVTVLIPAILWVVPYYGAVGAAWVWVALNSGYVLIHIQFMHQRLIPNEKSRWYFGDVLIPAVGAASVVLLAQQFQPASHQNRLAWLAFLIITGCLALVASTAMAKRTRLLLLAAVRNAFHVPT